VVASVEVTLLDLVVHPKRAGGLGNVATIVANAVQDDHIDARRIVETASTYRPAAAQRLGFVIDQAARHLGINVDLEALAQVVRGRRTVPLELRGPAHGPTDPQWHRWRSTRDRPVGRHRLVGDRALGHARSGRAMRGSRPYDVRRHRWPTLVAHRCASPRPSTIVRSGALPSIRRVPHRVFASRHEYAVSTPSVTAIRTVQDRRNA